MYAQVEKSKENKSQVVTSSVAQKKSSERRGFGFVDYMPEAIAQRKHQKIQNEYHMSEVVQLAKGKKSKHDRKNQALNKYEGVGGLPDIWRERPSALSSSKATMALINDDRNKHASRHLTDSNILANWNPETEEKFKRLVHSILTAPFNSFFYDLRGEKCKGYISRDRIAALVYDSSGLIATTYVASDEQFEQWGVAPSF